MSPPKVKQSALRGIKKLADVPGPEASGDVLLAHYRRVQEQIRAVHSYDDVAYICFWCADSETDLVFAKTEQPRGRAVYCTARCRDAYAAYMKKVIVGEGG